MDLVAATLPQEPQESGPPVFAPGTPLTPETATTPNYDETTLTFEQAAYRQTAIVECAQRNASNQFIANGAAKNYNANVESGQHHATPLPRPIPIGKYVVSQPDAKGLVYPEQSTTEFLVPDPPLDNFDLGNLVALTPSTAPPNVFMGIGPHNKASGPDGKWYDALYGDTIPSGSITGKDCPPATDGHTYEKFGSPVGWGWWLQIS